MNRHLAGWVVTCALAATLVVPAQASWVQVPVCTASGIQYGMRMVPDGSGGAIIAWTDTRNGPYQIFAQHLLSSDAVDPSWSSSGIMVATNVDGFDIAPDGAGGAIVAWDTGSAFDVYAHHVLAAGTLDSSWPSGGQVLAVAPDNQIEIRAVSDGAGGAIVTWQDYRNSLTTGWDIYAQKVLSSGVVDPSWPTNGLAVCASALDQVSPALVSDGNGGAIIAWEDQRNGTDADIFAHHLLGSGAVDPTWPATGKELSAAADYQVNPYIVSDGSAGAIVAWTDYRSGTDADVYAMRVTASGALGQGWHNNGEVLSNAASDQELTDLTSDGAGGAVAVWQDRRNGVDYDIYAARILGTSSTPWTADGVAVCTASNQQVFPHLTADGAGGFALGWQDFRNSGVDLYVHRLLATGSVDPSWPPGGHRVTFQGQMGSSQGHEPALLPDGSGGTVVAWDDACSSGCNILAMHLTAMGRVDVPLADESSPFRVLPNPVRGSALFSFRLMGESRTWLSVHDLQGRLVSVLLNERLPGGEHHVKWEMRDQTGRPVASGVYVVRFEAEGHTLMRRIVAVR
ncbi:MAG TPA: T9SS type A sorting domain-containing protein [Candidatus Eisenbacteria bacterium]|jgi:hypothetical protein